MHREKVQVVLWYSSNNAHALDFIKEFGEHAVQLKEHIDFTPRFISWNCPQCDSQFKQDECFSNGLYCAPGNIKGKYNSVQGRSILRENIRESCLYSILEAKGSEEKWWTYMKLV